MDLFKDIQMTLDGKPYEIRVLYDDRTINVLAFHNNYPASGFRHQIQLPKNCDVQEVLGEDIVDDLIEITKNEILEFIISMEKISREQVIAIGDGTPRSRYIKDVGLSIAYKPDQKGIETDGIFYSDQIINILYCLGIPKPELDRYLKGT